MTRSATCTGGGVPRTALIMSVTIEAPRLDILATSFGASDDASHATFTTAAFGEEAGTTGFVGASASVSATAF